MAVTADQVKELRERTGAGMMECKKALQESQGDFEKVVDVLRKSGIARAASRAGRAASEGVVEAYIHPGNRVEIKLILPGIILKRPLRALVDIHGISGPPVLRTGHPRHAAGLAREALW